MREADLRPYIDVVNRAAEAMGRYLDGWKPAGFSTPEPDWVKPAKPADAHCVSPMVDWFSSRPAPSYHYLVDGDTITPTFGGSMTATEFQSFLGRTVEVQPSIHHEHGAYIRIVKEGPTAGPSTIGAWLEEEQIPEFAAALFKHSGKIKVEEVDGYYEGPEYTTNLVDADQVWVSDDEDAELELHNAVVRLHAVTEYRKRKAADAAKEAEAKKEAEEAAAKAEAVAKEFPVGSLVTVATDADDVYFKGEGPFTVRNTNSADARHSGYKREGRILVQDGDDGLDQWVRPQDLTKAEPEQEEPEKDVPYFNISVSVSGDIDPAKIAEQIVEKLSRQSPLNRLRLR